MNAQHLLNCQLLKAHFEGREAIYLEKGVLRVRVFNIRWHVPSRSVFAEVQEIPTPGLENGNNLFSRRSPNHKPPLRWEIGSGYLTTFSPETWRVGYGGWSITVASQTISGLVTLAARWPAELDAIERYAQACVLVQSRCAVEKMVFQE